MIKAWWDGTNPGKVGWRVAEAGQDGATLKDKETPQIDLSAFPREDHVGVLDALNNAFPGQVVQVGF